MLLKAKLEAQGIGPWELEEEGGEIPWMTLGAADDLIPLMQQDGKTYAVAKDFAKTPLVEDGDETASRTRFTRRQATVQID